MEDRPFLSLVIPAYNEAAGIRLALEEAERELARLSAPRGYEILVVDDGSCDGTAEVVQEVLQAHPRVRLLRHASNRGYGAALRTGFEAARGDLVAFTDADCQFDLHDLEKLVAQAASAPIVAGYRVHRQDSRRRRFLSWGYNALVRTLLGTGVRDCDCALKVFHRSILQQLLPESPGFFVNTEMLTRARQAGLAVQEVGVRHRPRRRGVSKVSLADIPRTLATLVPFWWSRVLFPAAPPAEPTCHGQQRLFLGLTLLAVVALLLCFGSLGSPLQEPEEPRYAEIPRQMLQAHQWLFPVLHGEPYYDKPPLLYWLVLGSYRLFGVADWAARLVAGTAAFATVLVTFWWGRRTAGMRAGLMGALILVLSGRFLYLNRLLTPNSLLCLWVTAALATAHVALCYPQLRRGWWLLSAGFCGLGGLTKGPVSLVLVILPLALASLLDQRLVRPGRGAWMAYVATAVGVAAPWFVVMALQDPQFVPYFFWRHHVLRFAAPFDHAKPGWFYLPELLLGMLPWSLLLLPLARYLTPRRGPLMQSRPAALGVYLLGAVWGLIFFSLAGSKRPGYLLPVFPPLALALGCFLDRAWDLTAEVRRRVLTPRLVHGMTALALVAAMGGTCLAQANGLLRPLTGCVLLGVLFLALHALARSWQRLSESQAWYACLATTFAVLLTATQVLLPGYSERFSLREPVREQLAARTTSSAPVICYPRRWDSVSFYLQRDDVRAFSPEQLQQLIAEVTEQPETWLVVKAGPPLDQLLRELPASLEFVLRDRQGTVIFGIVRPRQQVPDFLLATR